MPSRKRSADPSMQPSMPHTSAIGQSTHLFAEPASITVPEFITFPVQRQSKRVTAHGHKCCQMHVRDGGVLIDVSRLKSFTVDKSAMTATVEPGLGGTG
jgi:hypothetical protein